MKKFGLILILFMLTFLPCAAKSKSDKETGDNSAPVVFIYHIPDEDLKIVPEEQSVNQKNDQYQKDTAIISDDVTADTSGEQVPDDIDDETDENEYLINDMYSDVLKGYAQYSEDEEITINLDDIHDDLLTLDIAKPFRVKENSFTGLKTSSLKFYDNQYSKYNAPEYSISPMSSTNYRTIKGFSAGTVFSQGIDYAELEQSSGVFSRYQYKNFALSTAYMKTVNSTNNNYNDNFYFAPEQRLNQYFTLKEILSADITKERRKAEILLSINPLGDKDPNRLKFELGASQTYDYTNAVIKSQFKFSTKFNL